MLIEKTVLDYLQLQDGIIDCFLEVPQNPPTQYILIERGGSDETNFVRSSMIIIQYISLTSLYEAATGCEWVKSIMAGMADAVENVYSCNFNTMYNFTDTRTKQYRYQSVYNISYQDDFETDNGEGE